MLTKTLAYGVLRISGSAVKCSDFGSCSVPIMVFFAQLNRLKGI